MMITADKTQNAEYNLYAVINHYTFATSGGHYTAYIQSSEGNIWVNCNDDILHCLSAENVVTKNAYLLFYKRSVMTSSNIIHLTYQSLE